MSIIVSPILLHNYQLKVRNCQCSYYWFRLLCDSSIYKIKT